MISNGKELDWEEMQIFYSGDINKENPNQVHWEKRDNAAYDKISDEYYSGEIKCFNISNNRTVFFLFNDGTENTFLMWQTSNHADGLKYAGTDHEILKNMADKTASYLNGKDFKPGYIKECIQLLELGSELEDIDMFNKLPLERQEKINSKEKIMSDQFEQEMETESIEQREPEVEAKSINQKAFENAIHQRIVISNAMKEGKLCCLPGEDGYADTVPAVNLQNQTNYHGSNLLFLKEHQKANGYPTAEYLEVNQIQKVKDAGFGIRKGEHGVSIFVSEKKDDEKWEQKEIRLFNVAQTNQPNKLKEYLEQKREERLADLQSQYGTSYKPAEKKPGIDIKCTSTEPTQYIGEYLAAVSMGSKFTATKEQTAEFSAKLGDSIWEKSIKGKDGEMRTNPFILSKIGNEASVICKNVIAQARTEAQEIEQPQQEQAQSRGRGR